MREGSRYAFLFDDLYAVTLCGTFFSVMHFLALLCWCLREASRKEGVPKMLPVVQRATWFLKTGFPKDWKLTGVFFVKHKWYRKQNVVVFSKKNFILVEINHFPGQSVLLKIKQNGPVNCFSPDFRFLRFTSPQKGLFFRSAAERQFLAHFHHAT